jgi:protein O-mannosyl-transferase
MMPPDNSVKKLVLAMAAVFAVTIALYLNSLSNNLVWDDEVFVGRNPFIHDCSNLKTVLNPVYLAKVLPVLMSARPMVNASLLLDTCSGTAVRGMRVTNMLLHAANAVLVLTTAYVFTGALAPALLAGLIFGLHPAAAEPVAIITFRSQLLCMFFYLSALLTGVVYVRHKNPAFLAGSVLAFLAAALSNEAGITFPLVFALLVMIVEKNGASRKALFLHLSICAAAAAVYFWFRLPRGGYALTGAAPFGPAGLEFLYPRALMPEGRPSGRLELLSIPPWSAIYTDRKLCLFTMVDIAAGYLRDLLLPLRLNGDYNPPVIRTFYGALPGIAALAAAGFGAFRLRRSAPLAAFGILFILAAFLPVMNVIPIYNIKADRYLYLPLAGFALITASAAGAASGKVKKAVLPGLLLYVVFLGALTFSRNPVFRDSFTFFSAATAGGAIIPRAEINMAAVYFARGEAEKAGARFQRALAAQDSYQIRLCWAEMEFFMGSRRKSLQLLETVLKEHPDNAKALYLREMAARPARGLAGKN